MFKSKIKWAGLGVLALSFFSLLVHLFVANSSGELGHYSALASFNEDLIIGVGDRKVLLLVIVNFFRLYLYMYKIVLRFLSSCNWYSLLYLESCGET